MKTVGLYTLGCKVNQYETEAITGLLIKNGYEIVAFNAFADVYIINTCTVTNLSDRKCRNIIRKAKRNNPKAMVVATGCYAQISPDEISLIEEVDLIIGTKDRNKLIGSLREFSYHKEKLILVDSIMETNSFEEFDASIHVERKRAYLKIQDGCSQFCSYCIIPYAKGPIRSRKLENILNEALELAKKGFKEIVITGIHIASYGKDLEEGSLIDVIKQVHDTEGILRISLGSLEPTLMTDDFVNQIKLLPKLVNSFHLSLQSGCDKTLNKMNRKYSINEYKEAVKRLRNNIPEISLTTDIIVGFPGETEEDFVESLKNIKDINFSKAHIFKYSPKKGTPAAKFKTQIAQKEKDERSEILIAHSDENSFKFNSKFINTQMKVLFDEVSKSNENYIEGLTNNHLKVISKGSTKDFGAILNVKITSCNKDYLEGEIIYS